MQDDAVTIAERSPRAPSGHPEELRRLGLGLLPPSVAETVSVGRCLGDEAALASLVSRLAGFRRRSIGVCLSVTGIGHEDDAGDRWEAFCGQLEDEAGRAGVSLRGLGFAVRSHCLPVSAFRDVPDRLFGHGPRFLFLDGLQMDPSPDHRAAGVSDENWLALFDRRDAGGLLPVYGGFVRSTCPMLADEVSGEVLPAAGLVVPVSSAWQNIVVPLQSVCDPEGRLREACLRRVAGDAVLLADDLVERCRWPDRRRNADAARNRRVAFIVTGVGDIALRQGLDPADFACLRHLYGLLEAVCSEFRRASTRLASERGSLLSLDEASPASGWFDGAVGDTWSRHFEAARRRTLVRHRNLVAMSPYSILPSGPSPSPAFADLLPLIALADAWCFRGAPSFEGWSRGQFTDFHRRARAVIQGPHELSRIAAEA